jgi:hypothetical protein
MKRVRTKEDFEKWYAEHGGDPWGYEKAYVKKRLFASIDFVRLFTPRSYEGNFIEFGAFKGDFTCLLASNFPESTVYANDISEMSLNEAKQRKEKFSNILFYEHDMLCFDEKDYPQDNTIILLLECLYYLDEAERRIMLHKLKTHFPESAIVISGPITGTPYFTEEGITRLFDELGYARKGIKVLTLRKDLQMFSVLVTSVLKYSAIARRKLANQVIFWFAPKRP